MDTRPPALAAVVVHFGDDDPGIAQTLELVRALEADPTVGDVMLVDNGPDRHDWPIRRALVVETGRNLGYGGGANAGIEVAIDHGAVDVAVMATDALVEPGTLAQLAASGRAAGAALSGPRIVYEGGETIWADGIDFDERWAIARNRNKGRAADQATPPSEQTPLTGHVLVFHDPDERDWLRFDPHFFMYYEDIDLCDRVRARGESIHFAASVVVSHRKSGGRSHRFGATQQFHMSRSGMLHLRRHSTTASMPARIIGFAALTVYRCLRSDSLASAAASWRGLVDGARVPAS